MSDPIPQIPLAAWIELQKTKLLAKHPFYGMLLTYLQLRPSSTCGGIASTDGVYLNYDPAYWQGLLAGGRDLVAQGLLVHETLHPALRHFWRRGTRDPRKWNLAADIVIDQMTVDVGLPLPDGIDLGHEEHRGLTEEEIYAKLPDEPSRALVLQAGRGGDMVFGADGQAAAGLGSALGDEWKDRVLAAAHAAKTRGTLPAGIDRLVEDLILPREDLRTVLARFVTPCPADYDWRRPDRRALASTGLVLPSLNGEQLDDVVVAIDLSGSITERAMQHFFGVLHSIVALYDRVSVLAVTFDAAVHDMWHLTSDSPLPTAGRGGGGTCTEPVFAMVDELPRPPQAVVIVTDGHASYPDRAPAYPVLWVLTPDHGRPPWGTSIVLEETVLRA